MKDRILAFLQNENKSYAQLADEIGVQPSGISHILSGRNNPSLDFVMKMLHRYPSLSAEWLLFGRAPMYKYASQPSLFENEPLNTVSDETLPEEQPELPEERPEVSDSPQTSLNAEIQARDKVGDEKKTLTRVLLIYSDKTFTEYHPS
jgi:transcriptional regulator with XRE-family HTH domain